MRPVAVSVLLLVLCASGHSKHFVDDYCWRDFVGIIPSDAFKAGVDKSGNPLYIGQVLFDEKLINGKIFTDSDYVYFNWFFREHSKNKNGKIFCTNQPQKFEWIKTSHNKVLSLMNRKTLVPGGFEEYTTYIGRVLLRSENAVGKVVVTKDECLGLFTTSEGRSLTYNDFEILTYNPSINDTALCETGIDIRFSGTEPKV
ncbi:hypothetical protein PPYR_13662 [Photinus pyralis]|uniref:Uncharacterized protein n=1 Tax=Photinus pyralis TaxID=7054 RepID=A0A5N4A9P0_PHOPY|nr:uncharacterized protein LOC116178232 [Photinus pyralis]KAB0794042.1 hypothetical protein PPYR_13662 [Photinus pyralis]